MEFIEGACEFIRTKYRPRTALPAGGAKTCPPVNLDLSVCCRQVAAEAGVTKNLVLGATGGPIPVFIGTQGAPIGLDQWEGRHYFGLKRHLILPCVSYLFLARVREKLRGKKSRANRLPSPRRCRRVGRELVA